MTNNIISPPLENRVRESACQDTPIYVEVFWLFFRITKSLAQTFKMKNAVIPNKD